MMYTKFPDSESGQISKLGFQYSDQLDGNISVIKKRSWGSISIPITWTETPGSGLVREWIHCKQKAEN